MSRHRLTDQISALFEIHGEVVTLADADHRGVSRELFRSAEAGGALTRVGKSAFVRTDELVAAKPWEAHRLRAIGFALTHADEVYLSGPSAQAVLKLPSVIAPPRLPMARRPGWSGRGPDRTPFGRIRTGYLPPTHRWRLGRARVASLAYTTVDASRYAIAEEALVLVDHALRNGISRDQLSTLVAHLANYPGSKLARWAIEHGDPRAESVLESLGRLAFVEVGRAAPLSNAWISDGRTHFRVDHLIPESGVILEGDGALKLDGRPDAHARARDRFERDRWLRGQGYVVEHYDYAMARNRRSILVRRADEAARSRRPGPLPSNWSLHAPEHLRHWDAI